MDNRFDLDGTPPAIAQFGSDVQAACFAANDSYNSEEFAVCRRLERKAVFIVGFARSSTTVTLQILNAAKNAFILGEANFYLPNAEARFRDWYNRMHIEFNNQITKSSYAPDFYL